MGKKGFTLVELMIVIAIIAILVAIVGSIFGGNNCPSNWKKLTINDDTYVYVSPDQYVEVFDMVYGGSDVTSIQIQACYGSFGGGEEFITISKYDEVERGFDYD